MAGFSFSRTTHSLALVADITSSSVAVAVVSVSRNTPSQVLLSERRSVASNPRDATQLASVVTQTLSDVVKKIAQASSEPGFMQTNGAIAEIHVVLGGPWVAVRTMSAKERFTAEKVIRDQHIQELAKKALQQPSDFGSRAVLETNVVRVHLNGYATGKPTGKSASQLSVTVFQSACDESFRSSLNAVFSAVFPSRTILFRSRTRALMTTLHERAQHIHHYFVVDVENDVTNCMSVRKDEVTEHATVTEGVSTFARRFGGEKGVPEETASLIALIGRDACTTPACEALRTNIARAESELTGIFGTVFGTLAEKRRIPNHCILIVHDSYARWCETFLARIDFSQFTITSQPFTVESLTAEHMRPYVLFSSSASEDTGIALATAFVHIQSSA